MSDLDRKQTEQCPQDRVFSPEIEQALRDSEERFRALSEAAFEGLVITRDGVILEVNQTLLDMTGYSRSDLIGAQALDLAAADSRAAVIEHALRGSQEPYEAEFRKKDGATFVAEVRGKPIVYKGEPARVGALIDITDRKQVEEALEAERTRLQTVLDSLPIAVWIADAKGKVIHTNKAMERIWGGAAPTPHSIEKYTEYKGWWADTGAPLKSEDWALARAVLKGETSAGEVIDIERFDGTRGTILNSASPIRDREGRIVGGVAAAQDMTDLRIAQQALIETERDLRRAQAVSKTGSWRLDTTKNELWWSDETYRIFGIPQGARMTYELFLDRVHPDDREYVDREWKAALSGAPYDIEHRVCVGSEVKWVRETAELDFDEQGQLLGGFGTVRDITDRKEAELALERALEETERDRRFITAIEGVSEAAISARSPQEMLQLITIRIREGMGTHSSTLLLLDEDKQSLQAVAACNIPELVGFRIPADRGFAGKVFRERGTVYIRDVQSDPLIESPHIRRPGSRSILGTPLLGRRGPVGVVYVDDTHVREFSEDERRLLEVLAARTALIVENIRPMEETSRNFVLLQRALLPPAPEEIPGYRLASTYRPGAAGAEIGGDFYDVFHTESGCVGILIGDVVGKGIPSASLAAATRSTLRAFIYDSSSPSVAIMHTNSVIGPEKQDPALFVTAHAAVLKPGTGRICYCGAGHPPPAIYRRATGEVEFLREGNPPVGVLDSYEFEEADARLGHGDKIIFYTDGLDEARRGTELFGLEGIIRVLEASGDRSADDMLAALLGAALDWTEGTLQDDLAIIVVEREAEQ